jgi:hypothetical protein
MRHKALFTLVNSRRADWIIALAVPAAVIVIAGCGSNGSPSSPSSGPSAVSTSSPSYRTGLQAGKDGYAEVQAFGPMGGSAMPYDQACQTSFNLDSADPSAGLVEQDYIQGCLYSLNHQSAEWTQTRKA